MKDPTWPDGSPYRRPEGACFNCWKNPIPAGSAERFPMCKPCADRIEAARCMPGLADAIRAAGGAMSRARKEN